MNPQSVRDPNVLERPPAGRRPGAYGEGVCHGHHGELLQGAFDVDGRVVRALVTLPCPQMKTVARARLLPGRPGISIHPRPKIKAACAAAATLDALDLAGAGVSVTLTSNIPIARGFGSSTADVVATARAIGAAAGEELGRDQLARIAVSAESASDPLMYDFVGLFAQREGRMLERLCQRLPRLHVLGCPSTFGPGGGVDTLALPPAAYGGEELARLAALRGALARALRAGDAAAIGSVATASAQINQAHLAAPAFEVLARTAERVGAVGLQVAHSGDVAGLLFDGEDDGARERMSEASRLLRAAGIETTWSFRTA